jgi:hypothetical protein
MHPTLYRSFHTSKIITILFVAKHFLFASFIDHTYLRTKVNNQSLLDRLTTDRMLLFFFDSDKSRCNPDCSTSNMIKVLCLHIRNELVFEKFIDSSENEMAYPLEAAFFPLTAAL